MKAFGGRALNWFLIRIAVLALSILAPLCFVTKSGMESLNGQLQTLDAESKSLQALDALDQALDSIVLYGQNLQLRNYSIKQTAAQVDRRLAIARHAREDLIIIDGSQLQSDAIWNSAEQTWKRVKRHPKPDIVDKYIETFYSAIESTANETQVFNDSSRTLRMLVEVGLIDSPRLKKETHHIGTRLRLLLRKHGLTFAQQVQAETELTLMQASQKRLVDNLLLVAHGNKQEENEVALSMKLLDAATTPFYMRVNDVVLMPGNANHHMKALLVAKAEQNSALLLQELAHRCVSQSSEIVEKNYASLAQQRTLARFGFAFLWGVSMTLIWRFYQYIQQGAREIALREVSEQARRGEELRRRNAEIALAAKTQMFKTVFERAPIGIATIDTAGDIIEWNPELSRFLGKQRTNLIGDRKSAFNDLLQFRIPLLTFERSFEGGDGQTLWASLVVSRIHDDGSHIALCMVQDITERRHAEARLRYEAMHDALTGLANRSLFRLVLGEVLMETERNGEAFAVFFIDLDLFKYVNDTFGHAAGDMVLGGVAERLRGLVGANDLIARFGGDEFAVLVAPPCTLQEAEHLAQAITMSIAEPFFWENHQVNIGSSIGLLYGQGSYHLAEDIMRNADTAMYAAKSGGRGRYVVFTPEMQDRAHQRAQLSNDLQSALGDPEQIHLLYIPIVNVKQNVIVGFEALARWKHPVFGDIPPEEFLKIAEQSGAIRRLGRSVMNQAFQQLATLAERVPDLSKLWLSVNISPSELAAPDFVESVAAAIRETDFDPSRLYLEITESRVIESGEQANRILSRLRDFGIRVALDDFGAGYSSLSYLQELDLDLIKIDQGFLLRPDSEDSRRAIFKAIVSLAGAFELPVCAEGVETSDQLRLVRSLGCQYAQGRIWGAPMSLNDIESRFAATGQKTEENENLR